MLYDNRCAGRAGAGAKGGRAVCQCVVGGGRGDIVSWRRLQGVCVATALCDKGWQAAGAAP